MEHLDYPITFSEWLRQRRKGLDLTQAELAQRAGCSVFALRKIESGERRPSKQLAGLLARALEIPTEDHPVFTRVARGELSLERLPHPARPSQAPVGTGPYAPARHGAAHIPAVHPGTRKPVACVPALPILDTPLIGRDSELAALEKLFNDPQCRLLTLTGVGGIGKTCLAVEFATRKASMFPGGVFYIPLAPVFSPEKVVPTIADVLDFGFSGPADPIEQMIAYLANTIQQPALFILDNLEQLLQDPASKDKPGLVDLVSEILRRLPNLKLLGTSRERLNLHGEWMYEVHGLSVPPAEFDGELEEFDATALFIRSAQRNQTGFTVCAGDRASVARICQLVAGVPLAIELAAAWVGLLSCQEIAQEIQSNMDILTTSMRDIPDRHRSIRATFEHSWKLLSDDERQALTRLSVFRGGFDRAAAGQIAGASLPLLASLSAKSLVRCLPPQRYDLHEVIRQYAAAHLQDDPQRADILQRHGEYYLQFVHDRQNALKSASQQDAVRQMTVEIDNIRLAWAWAVQHRCYPLLEQAARALGWYFEVAGLYREGNEQLELLVQALKAETIDPRQHKLLALALLHQALLTFRKGEFSRARSLYEESIQLLRPLADHPLLADALVFLGIILHLNGEYERALANVEEALASAREAGERWFEALAVFNRGYIASLTGCLVEGYGPMAEGLALWREVGDPHAIAMGLNHIVPTLTQLGRGEEAEALVHESIALCEQSKNRWGMGTAYRILGLVAMVRGQYADAQDHLRKSLHIFGEDFIGWDIARSLAYLGDASWLAGDLSEARKSYRDALRLSVTIHAVPVALDSLLGLGRLQARSGGVEQALMLCYFILNHPSSEAGLQERADQLRRTLEPELPPDRIRTARAAQEIPLEWIAQQALEME